MAPKLYSGVIAEWKGKGMRRWAYILGLAGRRSKFSSLMGVPEGCMWIPLRGLHG